jgi:acetyl esterase/lipase
MGPVIDRRVLLLSVTTSVLAACATGPAATQSITTETLNVWPEGPPGGEGVTAREEIIERSTTPGVHDRAIVHVRTPTLTVFRPGRPDGSAVLVLPGGAYQRVVLDKEGEETALRLARAGVTAAVLIYRLPEDGWTAGRDAPLQDAQRAMRLLRSRAEIDSRRVGVLGFSAGGHLAASLSLQGMKQTYPGKAPVDRLSARPVFTGLIYPAYLDGKGSPALLAGRGTPPDLIAAVRPDAQPMFLAHAADDPSAPVANTIRMYEALKAAGAPAKLHVFPDGGHGFGIAKAKGREAQKWPDLFLAWGKARGVFRG